MINEFGWWGFGPVFMILFCGAFILGIVALIRWLTTGSSSQRGRAQSAIEIVQARYARGEIDRQEYEQKMQDLEQRG